ncbi:MAG TPA: NAD(P)-binding protein, partial [Mycobacterium sp.]
MTDSYDAVVVGGGHNGLVAACYLGRAGKRVLVLERLGHAGGAAVSAQPFEGVDAQLSRYSYLVSLLPPQVVSDLGLPVRLAPRPYSSYTPNPETEGRTGLLVSSTASLAPDFYARCGAVTDALWPMMTSPLVRRSEVWRLVGDDWAWRLMVEEPIGHGISAAVSDDLSRGVVATDALIGTFARLDDESLRQNVCFLYHVFRDWHVPIGGMGAVTDALVAVAERSGVEIVCGADVFSALPDGEVRY